jgi:hypothetical protein
MPKLKTTFVIALSTVLVLTVVATQSPQAQTFTVLHDFTGGPDGANPDAGLTMDSAGNLYGTTSGGGSGGGQFSDCPTRHRVGYSLHCTAFKDTRTAALP